MENIISKRIELPCGINTAFRLFTEVEELESWLTVQAHVVPMQGGEYELFWDASNPEINSTKGCKITAIYEPEIICFNWKSPQKFAHFANNCDPLTHVTVTFLPMGQNTVLNLIHSGWGHTPEWQEAREWQDQAWDHAFESLKNYLKVKLTGQVH